MNDSVESGLPGWEVQYQTTREQTMLSRTRLTGYATGIASSIGVGLVTLIEPSLTTELPAVWTIVIIAALSLVTVTTCRTPISIRTGVILNTLLALSVIIHVEVLLIIHPGHEPPKLLLPLLIPILAMCLPVRAREVVPSAAALLVLHLGFSPWTQPDFIAIELVLLGISIFFALLSVHMSDQDRRRLAISQTRTLREQQRLQQANTTLEERVAERTKVAEERAVELKRLGIELNRAEQRERQSIARTLHDDLQQVLAAIRLRLASIIVPEISDNQDNLNAAEELLSEALETSRTLSVELAPYALLNNGLSSALDWLVRRVADRYELEVTTELDPDANPRDDEIATFLFHAARELLFNVVKHAGTKTAILELSLSTDSQSHILRVRDHGCGAPQHPTKTVKAEPISSTFGLPTMARRIQLMEGKMTVETEPSGGFSVTIQLPNHL